VSAEAAPARHMRAGSIPLQSHSREQIPARRRGQRPSAPHAPHARSLPHSPNPTYRPPWPPRPNSSPTLRPRRTRSTPRWSSSWPSRKSCSSASRWGLQPATGSRRTPSRTRACRARCGHACGPGGSVGSSLAPRWRPPPHARQALNPLTRRSYLNLAVPSPARSCCSFPSARATSRWACSRRCSSWASAPAGHQA
jgi:hypothetical protein